MVQWYVFSLISALFSSFSAVTQKKVLFKEGAFAFSIFLSLFNLLVALPFFLFVDFSGLSLSGLLVLFLKSCFGACAFLLVMLGLKNMEISRVLPFLVLTPGLITVFAFVFLGESLTLFEISGIILLMIGSYVLLFEKHSKEVVNPRAYFYIVLALLLFVVSSILDKVVLSSFNVPVNAFMGFQHLFFAIIFLALGVFNVSRVKISFKNSWGLILMISLFTILYRYSHLLAINSASVALAISVKRVSVFFAVVLGGSLFKEHNLLRKIIATLIMIVGVLLITFS